MHTSVFSPSAIFAYSFFNLCHFYVAQYVHDKPLTPLLNLDSVTAKDKQLRTEIQNALGGSYKSYPWTLRITHRWQHHDSK